MKKGRQRQKSGRHERRIAKIFDKAFYPDANGEFRRTPGSGGWDRRIAPGDIQSFRFISHKDAEMQFDKSFPFSIECKDWRDENVKHIFSGLYSKPSQIYDWIAQAKIDAESAGKFPIVVFKLYKTEDLVLMLVKDWNRLMQVYGLFPDTTYKVIGGPEEIIFCRLEPWIDWIDWEFVKSFSGHWTGTLNNA